MLLCLPRLSCPWYPSLLALQVCTASANLCLTFPVRISGPCSPKGECHHHKCATAFMLVPPPAPALHISMHLQTDWLAHLGNFRTSASGVKARSCKRAKILQQEGACNAGKIRDALTGRVLVCRNPSVVSPCGACHICWSGPSCSCYITPCASPSQHLQVPVRAGTLRVRFRQRVDGWKLTRWERLHHFSHPM